MADDVTTIFEAANDAWERGDLRQALKLFSHGAALGDPHCQNSAGVFRECGIGCTQDAPAAISLYRRAYRKERLDAAALNLASLYAKLGKRRLAGAWFERAIEQGDGDAALDFAKYILSGGRKTTSSRLRVQQILERALLLEATPDTIKEARALLKTYRLSGSFTSP